MTASYLPVIGLKAAGGAGIGELGVAAGAIAYVNLETELNKLSVDIQNGAVAPAGPVSSAASSASGKQTEVSINAEHEVSATASAIVTFVGEVEASKSPVVKVESGGNVIGEYTIVNGASAGKYALGTYVIGAGASYKVPTVSGLAKLFVSVAE